jgi:hypothetical protein
VQGVNFPKSRFAFSAKRKSTAFEEQMLMQGKRVGNNLPAISRN